MNRQELSSLCFLHAINGLGNKTLWNIKKIFGSFSNCLAADADRLYHSGMNRRMVELIIDNRRKEDPLQTMEQLTIAGVGICTVEDDIYPTLLRNIFDPPYLIYYYGQIDVLKAPCIAVVGSRVATVYGKTQAYRFGQEMAYHQITVVSGLARGVDTQAHLGSLEAGGKTVGVLGSGLDVVYPKENQKIFDQMREKGLVLSEFPLHMIPEPGNFPMRNRTISGLSQGVLVIEAKQKSGALITADFALEQGRDVFALPGPISSKNSEGTNQLIKQGAILVSCMNDILQEYDMNVFIASEEKIEQGELFLLDNKEIMVLECMGYDPLHFDEILAWTHFSIGELSASLMKLEGKGIVHILPGNCYIKI